MPTDGHSEFLKTGGSHIGADRLFWCWGKAPCTVPSAGRVGAEKQQAGRTAVRTAPIVCPEESPLPVALGNNFAVRNSPLVGLDAPTPARIGTGRPMGRSHFSFGGERKVCKRKPAARRLREKALYCPFLKEGVRNVARSTVGLPTFTFVLTLFLFQKGQGFFPPLPIAALLPRSWRVADLPLAGWMILYT